MRFFRGPILTGTSQLTQIIMYSTAVSVAAGKLLTH